MTPTKVGDIDGFVGTFSFEVGNSQPNRVTHVVWWERDGLAFQLSGTQLSEAETLAAAASTEPASDKKWSELLHATGADSDVGAASAGTEPAEVALPATIPAFTGTPRDVDIDVSVTEPSPNEQIWSGTLPTGEPWAVRVTRVYNTISFEPETDGISNGSMIGPLPRPADQELACCNPPNVVTADPNAASLRVSRSNGDRYTIALHDLPGADDLRIAVVGVLDGVQPMELLDAAGNVLQTL